MLTFLRRQSTCVVICVKDLSSRRDKVHKVRPKLMEGVVEMNIQPARVMALSDELRSNHFD